MFRPLPKWQSLYYASIVKKFLLFLGLAALSALGACSVTEQSAEGVGRQFSEGIQGRGQIVPNNPTEDSFGPEYR